MMTRSNGTPPRWAIRSCSRQAGAGAGAECAPFLAPTSWLRRCAKAAAKPKAETAAAKQAAAKKGAAEVVAPVEAAAAKPSRAKKAPKAAEATAQTAVKDDKPRRSRHARDDQRRDAEADEKGFDPTPAAKARRPFR